MEANTHQGIIPDIAPEGLSGWAVVLPSLSCGWLPSTEKYLL
jgi:hypothetical protein